MLSEQQIIREILDFVGTDANKVYWRLGVTNDCQRIFDSYADQRAAKKCFEAVDYQTAGRAVGVLLKQGFNGINTGLPLKDFRYIFLYQLPARYSEEAARPEAWTQAPALSPTKDTRSVWQKLLSDLSQGTHSTTSQAEVQPELKPAHRKPQFKSWKLSLFIIIGIIWMTSFFSSFARPSSPPSERVPRGLSQSIPAEEPLNSDFLGAGLECGAPLAHEQGSTEAYVSQLCWYDDEEGLSQTVFIEQSKNLDELLEDRLFYSCQVEGDATEDADEVLYYIRGSDFWMSGSQFFSSRTESNQQIQQIHADLSSQDRLDLALVDWCQQEQPGTEEEVTPS